MATLSGTTSPERPPHFSDDAWLDVLQATDRTCADLVGCQERLERQNAALEAMRTFLRAVLSSLSDVLIVADRGRALGKPLSEGVAPEEKAIVVAMLQTVRKRRRTSSLEANLLTASGVEPLDSSKAPRLDDRGRVDGFVLTGRLMGALRTACAELSAGHDALKTAQAQRVRNEKRASLGRLLTGVAHELNNPVSFVHANTHAVERDAIQGARDGTERGRDSVEDLRRLSSDGAGGKAMFDLADVVRIAANWVLRGMKQPVAPEMGVIGPSRVWGRVGHVQQVVMKLVQNSVDALERREGGVIRLAVQKLEGQAVLSVFDNRPGVPADLRAAIFDPFFTTRPVGRGTGLGLSISHKITGEQGGSLTLCEGTEGACFKLSLLMGAPA